MRKRILLLLHRIPFPAVGGDNVTNSNIVKILHQHFDLDVIVITYEDYSKEAEDFLNSHTRFFRIFKFPRWRFYLNAIRTLFNMVPLQVNLFYFPKIQKYINSIVNEYDLLLAGIVRTAEYFLHIEKPKIINLADSIGLNYKYSYHRTNSWFWKTFYFLEYPTMLRYERKVIKMYDRTLMFNKREIEYFNSGKIVQMPQAVKSELLNYEKTDDKYKNFVSFFGKMNYRPNVDAVLWFVEKVFKYLPEDLNFQIVGAYPVKEILELEKKSPRIFVRGYVDDPYLLLKSSLCVVAPMQTGGGIQNKILESMALGTIVITTPYSAFPIADEKHKALLVADKPLEWIRLIEDIKLNPEKYSEIKVNARNHIKSNFTFEKYESKLLEVIEEVLAKKN